MRRHSDHHSPRRSIVNRDSSSLGDLSESHRSNSNSSPPPHQCSRESLPPPARGFKCMHQSLTMARKTLQGGPSFAHSSSGKESELPDIPKNTGIMEGEESLHTNQSFQITPPTQEKPIMSSPPRLRKNSSPMTEQWDTSTSFSGAIFHTGSAFSPPSSRDEKASTPPLLPRTQSALELEYISSMAKKGKPKRAPANSDHFFLVAPGYHSEESEDEQGEEEMNHAAKQDSFEESSPFKILGKKRSIHSSGDGSPSDDGRPGDPVSHDILDPSTDFQPREQLKFVPIHADSADWEPFGDDEEKSYPSPQMDSPASSTGLPSFKLKPRKRLRGGTMTGIDESRSPASSSSSAGSRG